MPSYDSEESFLAALDSGELADSHSAGTAPSSFRPPHLASFEEIEENIHDFEDNDEFDDI